MDGESALTVHAAVTTGNAKPTTDRRGAVVPRHAHRRRDARRNQHVHRRAPWRPPVPVPLLDESPGTLCLPELTTHDAMLADRIVGKAPVRLSAAWVFVRLPEGDSR